MVTIAWEMRDGNRVVKRGRFQDPSRSGYQLFERKGVRERYQAGGKKVEKGFHLTF